MVQYFFTLEMKEILKHLLNIQFKFIIKLFKLENKIYKGFMWDIAPEFGAAIVFAEHRYYGESLPFGNETYSNVSTMAYLSSEQALGDFAVLIKYLKEKRIYNATKKAVVSFGGSYGGMLTAWMRIKVYNFF